MYAICIPVYGVLVHGVGTLCIQRAYIGPKEWVMEALFVIMGFSMFSLLALIAKDLVKGEMAVPKPVSDEVIKRLKWKAACEDLWGGK